MSSKTKLSKSTMQRLMQTQTKKSRSLSVDWHKLFGMDKDQENEKIHHGFEVFEKPEQTFLSGSKYKGMWNLIGFSKFGTYTYTHNVEYEGEISDGMFNGEGTFTYPNGHTVEVYFRNDRLEEVKIVFPDTLVYEEPWTYCTGTDRRFFITMHDGFKPACFENLTNDEVAREIPEGCYDTGDGFFNPITKCVQSALDPSKVIRIPTLAEEEWILANCRKAWDEPVGYRPDMYESWCTGRKYEKDDSSSDLSNLLNVESRSSCDL